MFRSFLIFTFVLVGVLSTACSPHVMPVQPSKPLAVLPTPPLKKPITIPQKTPVIPVKVQAEPLASPFFEGLRDDDLAWVQAQVKPSVLRHWHIVAQRSVWVRERILKGLEDAGAPQDLQVIPIVESAYQPYALSRTGAMGLWQLMPKTAQGLGIYKMKNGDGRRHVEMSTTAAAQYLMTQRKRFGNWPLAFAAYNMGPHGLATRLKKTPWQLSDGVRHMPVPKETRNYVIRILGVTALLHAHVLTFPKAIHTVKVTLHSPVDMTILEKKLNLPKDYLFKLNPQLHYSQYFHGSVSIHVPHDLQHKIQMVQKQYHPQYIHVRIRSGDSLWRLAKHYDTSISHLKALNPRLPKVLQLGHRIKVPAHGYGRATARLNPLLSGGRRIHYKVRKGDSLWSISRRFGTTTHAISRSNQLSKHHILRPGDTLWILARIRSS